MEDGNNQFEIIINFNKGGNPNRIFRSMADLIDSLQDLDATLAEVIGINVTNSLVLEDVKSGSLKTVIKNLIADLPDEALREADFKKLLGHYLVKGKYIVLEWCQNTPKLTSPNQVEALEEKLIKVAEESNINKLPAYQKPNRMKLLTNISSIQKSTRFLEKNDYVSYQCNDGESKVTNGIEISDSIVESVLTMEVIDNRSEAILKVKKADYLGTSKWVFKHEGHAIDVSITHIEWLDKFQHKRVSVQPGDSIRGQLVKYISYGYDHQVLGVHYELEYVKEVIEEKTFTQTSFDSF